MRGKDPSVTNGLLLAICGSLSSPLIVSIVVLAVINAVGGMGVTTAHLVVVVMVLTSGESELVAIDLMHMGGDLVVTVTRGAW